MNNIHEVRSFKLRIRTAFDEMERQGFDALAIPDSMGMVLVRKGSGAATAHDCSGNVLYQKCIEGKAFLVCLS